MIEELLPQLGQHLVLSLISLALSAAIGLALAVRYAHSDRGAAWAMSISNLGRVIPSLAVLACVYPLLGAGTAPAIAALVALGIPPILAGTITSLRSIDPDAQDAARGLGLDDRARMIQVELPLAAPGVLAAIRTSSTQIIASATLAALIGGGGLGELVMAGLTNLRYDLLILGALTVAMLALVSEGAFALVERRILPPGIRHATAVSRGRAAASTRGWAAGDALSNRAWAGTIVIVLALAGFTGVGAVGATNFVGGVGVATPPGIDRDLPSITIGSKDFTEQLVLAELYAQALEAQGYPVQRKLNLGATAVADAALTKGTIDLYPEYTGTALLAVLKGKLPSSKGPGDAVYDAARLGYAKRDMALLQPTPFSNGNAIVVTQKTANRLKLKSISDLARHSSRMRFGAIPGFATRPDGLPLLKKHYGLEFAKIRSFENGLKYQALKDGSIDAVYGFETDGQIHESGLVVLRDNRSIWPTYQAVPIVRTTTLKKAGPALSATLNAVSSSLDAKTMQRLNNQVDAGKRNPKDVAREYLKEHGFIKQIRRPKVTVGSKDFTEQIVLAELYAQALEARGFPVERRLNLGATAVADSALRKGTISMYPEYTGTAYTAVLNMKAKPGLSEKELYSAVEVGYRKRGLDVLNATPFSNGNAIVMTSKTAQRLKVSTLSDLADHAGTLRFASIPGADTRADGLPLLKSVYGIQFKSVRSFENGLKYKALTDGTVDAAFGFETDGQIHREKLIVLRDDQKIWPEYRAMPVVNKATSSATNRDFEDTLNAVSATLKPDVMRTLNDQVDGEKREPAAVAQAHLKRSHLA